MGSAPDLETCVRSCASSQNMHRAMQASSAMLPTWVKRLSAAMIASTPPILAHVWERPMVSHKLVSAPTACSWRLACFGKRRIAVIVAGMPPAFTAMVLNSLLFFVTFNNTSITVSCNSMLQGKSRIAWHISPSAPLFATRMAPSPCARCWEVSWHNTWQHANCTFAWPGMPCMHFTTGSTKPSALCRMLSSSKNTLAKPNKVCCATRWPPTPGDSCSSQKRSPASRSRRSCASTTASRSSAMAVPALDPASEAHCNAFKAEYAASPTWSSNGHPATALRHRPTPPTSRSRLAPEGLPVAMALRAPQPSRCTSGSVAWKRRDAASASAPPSLKTRVRRFLCAKWWPVHNNRKAPNPAVCNSACFTWSATALATNSKPPHSLIFGRCCGRSASVQTATMALAATSVPKARRPTTLATAWPSFGDSVCKNHVASSTVLYSGLFLNNCSATPKCHCR
mmetsp:Transcript_81858/g.265167  ORF Transcript_81858/g.265167 Transcript_81858/m.265167 type:complete len:454 (-) Transcript_81858:419-1780(-)